MLNHRKRQNQALTNRYRRDIMQDEKERPGATASLHGQLCALPKVDLHRHLEGSLRLRTLAEIAQEHGIDLPSYDIKYLRRFATVTTDERLDFQNFLTKFAFLQRFYPTQAAVERVAYEAVADAVADNIKYLELRFNPAAPTREQDFSLDQVVTWVCGAVARAQCDCEISVNLILQIDRRGSLDMASRIVDIALAHRDEGIVGLDLAGYEVAYPARRFADIFHRAAQEGLGITIHAGEEGGSENVREAIELLGANRIGHGVRSIENSEVVQLLRERGVTLEVCPTSNLQTAVVSRFGAHPLPDLLALGLRVTINTDDPSISDTTLTDEYMVAMMAMGMTLKQIKHTIMVAVEDSFQPPDERQRLAEWFRKEMELD
ncbi:MAG: adenosine deaminase [Anaerolineaceae bacterium 4572_32.2]|nr:MAG: adenosine deaminase [Anaerolineaceae bacterium 4572_32.2]